MQAKRSPGKSNVVDYDEESKQMDSRNADIEQKMESALKNEEFLVYFQPKYSTSDGILAGAEALGRWMDSKSGCMIYPSDFIPLFERNGFITKLDLYIFEHCCQLLHQWKEEGKTLVPLSVTFSRLHFADIHLTENMSEITQHYGVDPSSF